MGSILYLIFKRSEYAKQSFEGIRAAKPKRLYVFADGPRDNKPGEAELCQENRRIIEGVDWDCEVITNFQAKNLGVDLAAFAALDWFFEHEESGLYIEEDIVLGPGAAEFYNQTLKVLQENQEVGFISGYNYDGSGVTSSEYFYSSFVPSSWGLLTTRTIWQDFRSTVATIPYEEIHELFSKEFSDFPPLINRFSSAFVRDNLKLEALPWDQLLAVYCLKNKKLCILPHANLLLHIGLDGTHPSPIKSFKVQFGVVNNKTFTGPSQVAVDLEMRRKKYQTILSLHPSTFIGKMKNLFHIFISVRSFDQFLLQIKLFLQRRYHGYVIRRSK